MISDALLFAEWQLYLIRLLHIVYPLSAHIHQFHISFSNCDSTTVTVSHM